MAASPAPPARFENINMLRACAALSVVVYHVIEHGKWTDFPDSGPLAVLRIGGLGVDLFFVISGFVIAYSALGLYRADRAAFAPRYWKRRLTRILPLYLVTLFLYVAALRPSWSAGEWIWQLGSHLTFTHSFWSWTFGAIDGPNWSLAIEMQFYLAVALAMGWLDRAPAWRIALYAVLASWAWRGAMWVACNGEGADAIFKKVTQLPGTLDEFAAGIVLAKLVLDSRRNWFRRAVPWLAAAVATGCATFAVYWRYAEYWHFPGMVVFWRTALAVFFMCVVGAAMALPQEIARRWIRPGDYLGEISYGIYLWHLFAVNAFILVVGWNGPQALIPVLACTVLLAVASWHLLEKPALRMGRA
jgi:peptidoglycan/LPS O-acetylase OafA/YrhL